MAAADSRAGSRQSSRLDAMPLAKRMSNWLAGSAGFCECTHHGWLMKKGRRRWFVLSGGDLYWFDRKECDIFAHRPNNWLPLEADTTCARIDERNFTVRSEGRTYDMSAMPEEPNPEEDVLRWVEAIKGVIGDARMRQGGTTQPHRMRGYLAWKKSRLYFVLRDRYLAWFKSDSSRKPLGKLPMHGVEFERKSVNSVTVIRKDVSMDLVMASPREADDWFLALDNVAKALQRSAASEAPTIAKLLEQVGAELDAVVDGELVRGCATTLHSAIEVKARLMPRALAKTPDLLPSGDGCLLKARDLDIWLVPEHVPLHQLPLFGLCARAKVIPTLELVRKSELIERGIDIRTIADTAETRALVSKGFTVEDQRAKMIGGPYAQLLSMALSASPPNPDFLACRSNLLAYLSSIMPDVLEASQHDLFPQYIGTEPVPKSVPDTILISCVLPRGFATKLASFAPDTKTSAVKELFFGKFVNLQHDSFAKDKIEDFKLKVIGIRSYLEDDIPIISFDYVRACINHGVRIELSLVSHEGSSAADVAEDTFLFKLNKLHSASSAPPIDDPIAASSMEQTFRIRIVELEALQSDLADLLIDFRENNIDVSFTVSVALYYGTTLISTPMPTRAVNFRYRLKAPDDVPKIAFLINQWLVVDCKVCRMPRESQLLVTLEALQNSGVNSGKSFPLGYVCLPLFDRRGLLAQQARGLRLWPGEAKAHKMPNEYFLSTAPTILQVEFQQFDHPIVFDPAEGPPEALDATALSPAELELLMSPATDLFKPISDEQRAQIFAQRTKLVDNPRYLLGFLRSVNWCDPVQTREAHALMHMWAKPPALVGLELLDFQFADLSVREYAVGLLDQLGDGDVADYLLQLVSVAKYELHHDSALSKFLVRRALLNKTIVGHTLFWLLKSELHTAVERLGTLLEAYLRGCGLANLTSLSTEEEMLNRIAAAGTIVKSTAKAQREEIVQWELRKMTLPLRFRLPLFSDRECSALVLSACKCMKSKKLPLWLVFRNADVSGEDSHVIFKLGDDLRQDVLTLQMLRLMDKFWIAEEGLDLRLLPYGVICTGMEEGMVEIVRHAETIGGIHRQYGGTTAVFKQDVIARWLKSKNPTAEAYADATKNFALSLAGYCVFTYVLGIGDRHNDNLMLRTDGRLFHIDFGHFLGHFKSKLGVKRERAPFIFTPQFSYVLGGPGAAMYTLFQMSCARAYGVLRSKASTFTTLFTLMLCAGLPELQSAADVRWITDHLRLDLSDADAESFFLGLIDESLHTVSTQLMDLIHIIAN